MLSPPVRFVHATLGVRTRDTDRTDTYLRCRTISVDQMEQQSRGILASVWTPIIVALITAATAIAVALITKDKPEPKEAPIPVIESNSIENTAAEPVGDPAPPPNPTASATIPRRATPREQVQRDGAAQPKVQPQTATTVIKQACVNSNTAINQPTINNCGDVSQ